MPCSLLLPLIGSAQHSEQDIPSHDSLRGDSHLYEMMKRGEVEGRFRQYNMLTINDGAPSDYHAVAFGGVLGFTSQRWHGTRFKLTGGYTFDLATSDLTQLDPVTGLPNRYEIGLYDVNDPRRTNDLAYLHEFQLDHLSRNGRTNVVFGKQELNTPFLNPQDGRMHPTLFEGLWVRHRSRQGTTWEGGWLYRVAPRGSSEWYHGIGEHGRIPSRAQHLWRIRHAWRGPEKRRHIRAVGKAVVGEKPQRHGLGCVHGEHLQQRAGAIERWRYGGPVEHLGHGHPAGPHGQR